MSRLIKPYCNGFLMGLFSPYYSETTWRDNLSKFDQENNLDHHDSNSCGK